jgi:hypothetical protein
MMLFEESFSDELAGLFTGTALTTQKSTTASFVGSSLPEESFSKEYG